MSIRLTHADATYSMGRMETIILNELRERFVRSMWARMSMDLSQNGLETMKRHLSDLPSETVYYLGSVFNDNPSLVNDGVIDSLMIYMLGESDATAKEIEDVACVYLHSDEIVRSEIAETMPRSSSHAIPSPILRNMLDGLRSYEMDGFSYDSTKSLRENGSHTMDQCIGLIKIARTLRNLTDAARISSLKGPLYIEDASFAQLVADFPHDFELVNTLIFERGAEADLIREVLTAPHRALSEGVL